MDKKLIGRRIEVLDKGWIILDDYMKGDLDVVRHARESTTADLKGDVEDKKLLKYLYSAGHVSPFAMPQICFRIYLPVFVMRQFIRHWSLNFNEMSGRYIKLPEENYIPVVWRKQAKKNKQGSTDEPFSDDENTYMTDLYREAVRLNRELEKQMKDNGVANEMVRFNQLLTQYTRISVVGSLRDWAWGFLRQRLDAHAQPEIRVYAFAIGHFIRELFPNTMSLFYRHTLGDLKLCVDDFRDIYAEEAVKDKDASMGEIVLNELDTSEKVLDKLNKRVGEVYKARQEIMDNINAQVIK